MQRTEQQAVQAGYVSQHSCPFWVAASSSHINVFIIVSYPTSALLKSSANKENKEIFVQKSMENLLVQIFSLCF
jgi:hypothetical protein